MTSRSALIIGRVGDGSLHRHWLLGSGARSRRFDLHLSYYGEQPDPFPDSPSDVTISHDPGAKFPGLTTCIQKLGDRLDAYNWICFVDDDVWARCAIWNRYFDVLDGLSPELSQPALMWRSFYTYEITLRRPHLMARWTNFAEIMNFCFRQDFFQRVKGTFSQSVSGWGLDFLWASLVENKEHGIAIVDASPVLHTRALGHGGLYDVLPNGMQSAFSDLDMMKELQPDKLIAYCGVKRDGTPIVDESIHKRLYWPKRLTRWRRRHGVTRVSAPSGPSLLS
jgi:hypothetical protein